MKISTQVPRLFMVQNALNHPSIKSTFGGKEVRTNVYSRNTSFRTCVTREHGEPWRLVPLWGNI